MLSIIVESPWIAGIIALGLWALWKWRRRKSARAASVMWALYCGYEYLMHARVLCSGECNIRVDLLALYPTIAILTLVAMLQNAKSSSTAAASPGDQL
jgi:hypothetical protein